jgi:hypothetical protein
MGYKVAIEGCEGKNIELAFSFWTGSKLLINGQKAPRGTNRKEMLITRDDGTTMVATWKSRSLGFDIPNLLVNGKEIQIAPSLKWYEMTWCGLPLLLIFVGGGLGAIIGVLAFFFSTGIFRSNLNVFVKFFFSAVLTVTAYFIWLFAAVLITQAIG